MSSEVVEVQCPQCLTITKPANRSATSWDCPCGYSYNLRRCSACGVVSHVTTMQRRDEPWPCVWCKAANRGYATRLPNRPAIPSLS
jgi:hypothetical protein